MPRTHSERLPPSQSLRLSAKTPIPTPIPTSGRVHTDVGGEYSRPLPPCSAAWICVRWSKWSANATDHDQVSVGRFINDFHNHVRNAASMSDLISRSACLTEAPHAALPLLSHLLFLVLSLVLAVVQLLTITAVSRCTADVIVTLLVSVS